MGGLSAMMRRSLEKLPRIRHEQTRSRR